MQRKPVTPYFVVSAYSVGEDCRLVPEVPLCCPNHNGNNISCSVFITHWRRRKTGPLDLLAVAKCKCHRKAFTLYPYGLLPHKRQLLVGNLDHDGSIVHTEDTITFTKDTLFEGACDKVEGENWEKEQSEKTSSSKRFDTQSRHIRLNAEILALSPQSTQTQAITEVLRIDTLKHSEYIVTNPSLLDLSQGIITTLKSLSWSKDLFERLAVAGYIAGLFPRMYLLCSRTKQIYLSKFHKFALDI